MIPQTSFPEQIKLPPTDELAGLENPYLPAEYRDRLEKIQRLRAKADALLKRGDSTGGAEGRRLLRECRRVRRLVRQLILPTRK